MKKFKFLTLILCLTLLFPLGTTLAEKSSAGRDDFKRAQEFYEKEYYYSALFFAGRAYDKGYTDDNVVAFIGDASRGVSKTGYQLFHQGKKDLAHSHYALLTTIPCVPEVNVNDAKANLTFIPPFK